MDEIYITQAAPSDIPVIEAILLEAVNRLNAQGTPLWGADEVEWDSLSESYAVSDFYVASLNGNPSGCMALVERDPYLWPNVPEGESLFIHKLAVTNAARKTGVSNALMEFYKEQGRKRGVKSLRLDTHARRPRLRAFYERRGFTLVEVKTLNGDRHTAFYELLI